MKKYTPPSPGNHLYHLVSRLKIGLMNFLTGPSEGKILVIENRLNIIKKT